MNSFGLKSFLPLLLAGFLWQGCAGPRGASLHDAVLKNDRAGVENLLRAGAAVDAADARGQTPLFLAARDGHKEIAELLIAHGANPAKRDFWKSGNAPLHVAAERGQSEIVQLLLDKGVKVNFSNRHGQTALLLAAWNRHPDTFALLLKRGADIKAADYHGWTVLHSGWHPQPPDASYEEVIQLAVAKGARVNASAQMPQGYTPLMAACLVGDKEIVELLLKSGADVNAGDQERNTAYTIADRLKRPEIKAILFDHGAQPMLPLHSFSPAKVY